MNVIDNSYKEELLCNLLSGDVFEYAGEYYVKLAGIHNHFSDTKCGYCYCAVLVNGNVLSLESHTKVVKISAEVHLK